VRSGLAASSLAAVASLVVLFACQDNIATEPEFARINNRYEVTIRGTGSQAGGTVTSDRGGISCTVATGGAASGKCSQGYKSGAIVTLTLTPASSAKLKLVSSNCAPSGDTGLACHVTVTGNMDVLVNFEPQSNTFTLSISAGAAGSGGVGSNPSGISCTITNGSAGSTGCSAAYALNQQVTLTATAASGSYLKAWAGGGCDASGTGVGGMSGVCVVVMSQAVSVVVSFDRPANAALVGQWGSPVDWPAPGVAIHANMLPNGQLLTWGRTVHQPVLWNPSTGAFGSASEPVDLFCSGHTLLPDGRILVAGGHSGVDSKGITTSELYDYASNTWQAGPAMRNGRWYPTNLSLASGEVLTISGGDTAGVLNVIPEVWSPGGADGTGAWRALTTATASLPYFPMMFVAPNGTAYVAGPNQSTGYLSTSGTGSWTAGPNRTFGGRDYGSAVMYDAGKILAVGGGSPTRSAEVIDLNAGGAATWRRVDSMAVARRQMNATLLADGTVLATGGSNAAGFNTKPTDDGVLAAERWDPTTERWTALARQTHYRLYHSTAVLLPDARVLSVGSGQPAATGLTDDYTGEVFSPPYLFKLDGTPAVRPTVSSAPTDVGYNASFAVTVSSAAPIAKVTWIRLSTVTHATNMNQRMNYLSFTANGSALTVTSPANANLAPPGHYMLFVVDANGVPSVAKIVRIS
jgi:galactose oxidase-like protein/List-Bact-rpt repeat protein